MPTAEIFARSLGAREVPDQAYILGMSADDPRTAVVSFYEGPLMLSASYSVEPYHRGRAYYYHRRIEVIFVPSWAQTPLPSAVEGTARFWQQPCPEDGFPRGARRYYHLFVGRWTETGSFPLNPWGPMRLSPEIERRTGRDSVPLKVVRVSYWKDEDRWAAADPMPSLPNTVRLQEASILQGQRCRLFSQGCEGYGVALNPGPRIAQELSIAAHPIDWRRNVGNILIGPIGRRGMNDLVRPIGSKGTTVRPTGRCTGASLPQALPGTPPMDRGTGTPLPLALGGARLIGRKTRSGCHTGRHSGRIELPGPNPAGNCPPVGVEIAEEALPAAGKAAGALAMKVKKGVRIQGPQNDNDQTSPSSKRVEGSTNHFPSGKGCPHRPGTQGPGCWKETEGMQQGNIAPNGPTTILLLQRPKWSGSEPCSASKMSRYRSRTVPYPDQRVDLIPSQAHHPTYMNASPEYLERTVGPGSPLEASYLKGFQYLKRLDTLGAIAQSPFKDEMNVLEAYKMLRPALQRGHLKFEEWCSEVDGLEGKRCLSLALVHLATHMALDTIAYLGGLESPVFSPDETLIGAIFGPSLEPQAPDPGTPDNSMRWNAVLMERLGMPCWGIMPRVVPQRLDFDAGGQLDADPLKEKRERMVPCPCQRNGHKAKGFSEERPMDQTSCQNARPAAELCTRLRAAADITREARENSALWIMERACQALLTAMFEAGEVPPPAFEAESVLCGKAPEAVNLGDPSIKAPRDESRAPKSLAMLSKQNPSGPDSEMPDAYTIEETSEKLKGLLGSRFGPGHGLCYIPNKPSIAPGYRTKPLVSPDRLSLPDPYGSEGPWRNNITPQASLAFKGSLVLVKETGHKAKGFSEGPRDQLPVQTPDQRDAVLQSLRESNPRLMLMLLIGPPKLETDYQHFSMKGPRPYFKNEHRGPFINTWAPPFILAVFLIVLDPNRESPEYTPSKAALEVDAKQVEAVIARVVEQSKNKGSTQDHFALYWAPLLLLLLLPELSPFALPLQLLTQDLQTAPLGHASDSTIRPTSDSTVRPASTPPPLVEQQIKVERGALPVDPTTAGPSPLQEKAQKKGLGDEREGAVKAQKPALCQGYPQGARKVADPPQAPQKSQTGRTANTDQRGLMALFLKARPGPPLPTLLGTSFLEPSPGRNPRFRPIPDMPHIPKGDSEAAEVAEGLEGRGTKRLKGRRGLSLQARAVELPKSRLSASTCKGKGKEAEAEADDEAEEEELGEARKSCGGLGMILPGVSAENPDHVELSEIYRKEKAKASKEERRLQNMAKISLLTRGNRSQSKLETFSGSSRASVLKKLGKDLSEKGFVEEGNSQSRQSYNLYDLAAVGFVTALDPTDGAAIANASVFAPSKKIGDIVEQIFWTPANKRKFMALNLAEADTFEPSIKGWEAYAEANPLLLEDLRSTVSVKLLEMA
ncbi:hypothetical protein BS47DRAFT_1366265, partial [Hydnum rufescens UP504]